MERSRRSYFLLLALASGLGWSYGLWAVPLISFAVLETAWTVGEWARDRGSAVRSTSWPPSGRSGLR